MMSRFQQEWITEGNGVLLRTVDDFLYISRSKENTISLKDHMIRGIPELNSFVNKFYK